MQIDDFNFNEFTLHWPQSAPEFPKGKYEKRKKVLRVIFFPFLSFSEKEHENCTEKKKPFHITPIE